MNVLDDILDPNAGDDDLIVEIAAEGKMGKLPISENLFTFLYLICM